MHRMNWEKKHKGFTVLELLVAVSVTALLAAMLFNITSQVIKTQTQSSADLETNQVAQFIFDRIQEDLQCAIFRNDGNVWMAATIINDSEFAPDKSNDPWSKNLYVNEKPGIEDGAASSLRISVRDWQDQALEVDDFMKANAQGKLEDCRFGQRGVWLRFFTQAPEIFSTDAPSAGARAISYQIVRYGLMSNAPEAQPRYQLFRSDVDANNTLSAGYNLNHPLYGGLAPSENSLPIQQSGIRSAELVKNPIVEDSGIMPTAFSLAANVIDFGIRAYVIDHDKAVNNNDSQPPLYRPDKETAELRQIFPIVSLNEKKTVYHLQCSSRKGPVSIDPTVSIEPKPFPQVIDVMIRILTSEGASVLALYEENKLPIPSNFKGTEGDYWWKLAEENSDVFIRRIKIFSEGV